MTLPRPLPAIVKPGVLSPDDELQALAHASFQRRLTRDEQARVSALSFTPDAEMERVRLIRDRHPDLYGQVLHQLRQGLEGVDEPGHRQEGYETRRAAAVEAGRAVLDPSAQIILEIDTLAAEYRATAVDPYTDTDARNRAVFRAAITSGDFAGAIAAWAAWLAEHAERNAFAGRRSRAVEGFGRSWPADRRRPPSFVPELEDALGGGTIRETQPISPR